MENKNIIYLVVNIEDLESPFIINITKDLDIANSLCDEYNNNFNECSLEYFKENPIGDVITVVEVDLNETKVFDIYKYYEID